jgi:hypothetical protein
MDFRNLTWDQWKGIISEFASVGSVFSVQWFGFCNRTHHTAQLTLGHVGDTSIWGDDF